MKYKIKQENSALQCTNGKRLLYASVEGHDGEIGHKKWPLPNIMIKKKTKENKETKTLLAKAA